MSTRVNFDPVSGWLPLLVVAAMMHGCALNSDSSQPLLSDLQEAQVIGRVTPISNAAGKEASQKNVMAAPATFSPSHSVGDASWYGPGFRGKKTASGEIFDDEKLTAAHKTLPLGSKARVTNLSNQKSVEVEINDRGPFVEGRIIDLSKAAARALDMIEHGIVKVRVELLMGEFMANDARTSGRR